MKPFILIVDDEETLTFFLKRGLEKEGYKVETTTILFQAKVTLQFLP